MSKVSKARLIKLIIDRTWDFGRAQFVHKIGEVGIVCGMDQTDFVSHTHLKFADGMTGVFLDEEIEDVSSDGDEVFESTKELRTAYSNIELLVCIKEVQIAQVKDDTGRGHQFISCLLYTSPSPRDRQRSRMPSSA